jgi:hypothetical protein
MAIGRTYKNQGFIKRIKFYKKKIFKILMIFFAFIKLMYFVNAYLIVKMNFDVK